MTKLARPAKLVIASHNAGKVREIKDLLAPLGIEAISAADLELPEPVEDGATFEENAALKARAAAKTANLPALSDDSGLCVTALGGAPGIYSARWAGPEKDFHLAMSRIEDRLGESNAEDRSAHFVCVLTLAEPEGACHSFEGQVHGALVWPPRGEKGFGYDPMFVPQGETETFGEIEPARKHAMSHRARAFEKLLRAFE